MLKWLICCHQGSDAPAEGILLQQEDEHWREGVNTTNIHFLLLLLDVIIIVTILRMLLLLMIKLSS